jgi:allophanate hydrolase
MSGLRVGIPREQDLKFFNNIDVDRLYRESIDRARSLGATIIEIDYHPFAKAAELLYAGPWLAERFLVAKDVLQTRPDAILPITRSILLRGQSITAADAFAVMYQLESHKQSAATQWQKMDVLLLPTAGTIYTLAQVEADPIVLNTNLGYYTNFVNLMDLCAVAVPGGFQSNGLPAGVSVIAPSGSDFWLAEVADELHRALGVGPGVAKHPLRAGPARVQETRLSQMIKLAVVGAHLSGMPLNHQLTQRGATVVRAAKTSPDYRFYALPGTAPPKPGLVRVGRGETGGQIDLEIWEMSAEAFGTFVAAIPPPLGIGTIQLEDGSSVQGFLCESCAIADARDITSFGGWRAFIKST